jgi:hypothetical protein
VKTRPQADPGALSGEIVLLLLSVGAGTVFMGSLWFFARLLDLGPLVVPVAPGAC